MYHYSVITKDGRWYEFQVTKKISPKICKAQWANYEVTEIPEEDTTNDSR